MKNESENHLTCRNGTLQSIDDCGCQNNKYLIPEISLVRKRCCRFEIDDCNPLSSGRIAKTERPEPDRGSLGSLHALNQV